MKPDKIICRNCGKQIPKGKWCSDKCRMAYKRTEKANKPEHEQPKTRTNVPEQTNPNTDEFRATLTKTDKTFYDRAMRDFKEPYYRFSNKVHDETCIMQSCKSKFRTSLAVLKYCSYEHYSQSIAGKK